MHGRPRIKVKTSEEIARQEKEKELKKIEAFSQGLRAAMELCNSNTFTEESLKPIEKVLTVNPELYTLWNHRRRVFLHLAELGETEKLNQLYKRDLQLIEDLIPSHPKSYWLWFHRTWITSNMAEPDWKRELGLCTKMLESDERNFHCWGYRRYVAQKAGVSNESEYAFSTKKIESNFSNYSAWHQRSKLIPLLKPTPQELKIALNYDFELIQNAFYTEPKDQSAWFYYHWLIGQTHTELPKEESIEILERELQRCTEFQQFLNETETGSDAEIIQKWPLMSRTIIMIKLNKNPKEILVNLTQLKNMDRYRQQYYVDIATQLLQNTGNQSVEELTDLMSQLKS